MRRAFATLISLLCLFVVLGYMAGEAQAQGTLRSHSVSAGKAVVKRASLQRERAAEVDPTQSPKLKSSVALVVDQNTGETLFEKNGQTVLPIASITKLMTALVVLDAEQSLDEAIRIDSDDIDMEKGTRSRLTIGTELTRGDALHLALMASENRAASALGRHYPGGISAFVEAMNAKARLLNMNDTHYVDSSGLSPQNQSSGHDLVRLLKVAYEYPVIREFTTSPKYKVNSKGRSVEFGNTNRLVLNPNWQIGLQKTGYISEAGQCLIMQATISDRDLLIVLLNSQGKLSRIGDAGRLRSWIESHSFVRRPSIESSEPSTMHGYVELRPVTASISPTGI
jgi:D-alanyl-D-alanine endopeptidase (penicillin-binding protein 7)